MTGPPFRLIVTAHFGDRDRRDGAPYKGHWSRRQCCVENVTPGPLPSTVFFALEPRMPKQQLSLRMIKDVLRLKWHAQLSHEQVAATLKISKGVVAKYVGLATAAGLDWDTVQDWSEQQLSTALQPRSAASLPIVVPDWGRIHRELDRKGVTLMLLWQEASIETSTRPRTFSNEGWHSWTLPPQGEVWTLGFAKAGE